MQTRTGDAGRSSAHSLDPLTCKEHRQRLAKKQGQVSRRVWATEENMASRLSRKGKQS